MTDENQLTVLLKDSAIDETGDEVAIPKHYGKGSDEILIQVDISGATSVELLGRITAQAALVTIFSGKIASEIIPIAWVPFLQVVTTLAGSPIPNVSVYALRGTG